MYPFEEVLKRFREIRWTEQFDMIVAIANGGIVPAGILNEQLQIDFQVLKINLRDEFQQPKFPSPVLLAPPTFPFAQKRILLVDDRIKSGLTIQFAKEILKEAALVKTFAVNGNADYALYDEPCFKFPWK